MSRSRPALLVLSLLSVSVFAAEDVLLARGEHVLADVTGGAAGWRIAGNTFRTAEVLCIRFCSDPPPASVASGVFIRGGSMLSGSLASRIGDTAEVTSNTFGALTLKTEEVAGAFSPMPPGQAENMPELSRYASLAAAVFGSAGTSLQPGKRMRLKSMNLDETQLKDVMRVSPESIMVEFPDKRVETINRSVIRLIEIGVPPLPAPGRTELALGPEVFVRLRNGDLIRGRVVRLDDKALTLRTTFAGEKALPRGVLAAIFLAGDGNSGVTWLSAQTPAKAQHTPLFDAEFPARMDSSVGRNGICVGNQPCERGLGVHSKSVLEYTLAGAPQQRFVAICGIDAETKGRGEVVARILADGEEKWNSGPVKGKDPAKIANVDISGAKTLTLEVDFGPDNDDSGDHFDWGWAAVISR